MGTETCRFDRHHYYPHSLTTDTQLPLTLTTSLHGYPLKKGVWSSEEDTRLQDAVKRHGAGNWATISEHVRTRDRESCLDRWHRYLKPEVKGVVKKGCYSLTHSLTHSLTMSIKINLCTASPPCTTFVFFCHPFLTTLTMTVQVRDRGDRNLQV